VSKMSKGVLKATVYMLVCAAIGFLVSYYGMLGVSSQLKLESLSLGWYSYDIVTILLLFCVAALLAFARSLSFKFIRSLFC